MITAREIRKRRCLRCEELAVFTGLYDMPGFDPRLGVFYCKRCRSVLYDMLTVKEHAAVEYLHIVKQIIRDNSPKEKT